MNNSIKENGNAKIEAMNKISLKKFTKEREKFKR